MPNTTTVEISHGSNSDGVIRLGGIPVLLMPLVRLAP
jgi:hypothetical protein